MEQQLRTTGRLRHLPNRADVPGQRQLRDRLHQHRRLHRRLWLQQPERGKRKPLYFGSAYAICVVHEHE
jgi:hypothetical protein